MILYIIKATVCSILLLLVYRFLLQREKMYIFNRLYLLFSLVFSLLVPLITFTSRQALPPLMEDLNLPLFLPVTEEPAIQVLPVAPAPGFPYFAFPATVLYSLVAGSLLVRFIRNLHLIRRVIAGGSVQAYHGARLILLDQAAPPHSFLRYIFLSRADYQDVAAREVLLTHELCHVRQHHSWDILFVEGLQVLFWFNPALLFYKKAIQLNHELQADDTVIEVHGDVRTYQNLLLQRAQQEHHLSLTSHFHFFITKKRLIMMTKTANRPRIACLQLALLPLLAGLVFLFSGRIYAQERPPIQEPPITRTHESVKQDSSRKVVYFEVVQHKAPGPGATKEQLEKFQKILDKSERPGAKGVYYNFTAGDKQRLKTLHATMTRQQREAFPFVIFGKTPAAQVPTDQQLQTWNDTRRYGVWIDNKRVANEELAHYKATDFVHYDESRLYEGATNYGKHAVQVNLWTVKNHKDHYNAEPTETVYVIKKAHAVHLRTRNQ